MPNWSERPNRPGSGIRKQEHVSGIGRRLLDDALVQEVGRLVTMFREHGLNAEMVEPTGVRYMTRRELAEAAHPPDEPPYGKSIEPQTRVRPNVRYAGSPLSAVTWIADFILRRVLGRGDPMLRAQMPVRVGAPEWREIIPGHDTEDDRRALQPAHGYTLVLPLSEGDLGRVRVDNAEFESYKWHADEPVAPQRLGGVALFTVRWSSADSVPQVTDMPDPSMLFPQSTPSSVMLSPVQILTINDQR
jgi:hypothetical protein